MDEINKEMMGRRDNGAKLEEVKIHIQKSNITPWLIISLIFVSIGLYGLLVPDSGMEPGVGIIAVIFFGACGFSAYSQRHEDSPILILNDEGLYYNYVGTKRFIKWDEMLTASIYRDNRYSAVRVILREEGILSNKYADIITHLIDMSDEDLVLLINSYIALKNYAA